MKRVYGSKVHVGRLRIFYDLLYNYSHKKFNDFLSTPEVRFLIRKFLDSSYIDILISNNPTLQPKSQDYKECAAMIVANIEVVQEGICYKAS